MAEFMQQEKSPIHKFVKDSGFDAMGKPVPLHRKTAALEECKIMGLDGEKSWACVGAVAEQLERDQPYEAMAAGMRYLDLIGTYRLMAVLLTATEKKC